jgi:hypothetical protein
MFEGLYVVPRQWFQCLSGEISLHTLYSDISVALKMSGPEPFKHSPPGGAKRWKKL